LGGAVGDNDHHVFAADAELTGDVDAGLVREGHTGFEDGGAATDEIRILVAIETDAMAEAVGEEFVVRPEAGGSDDAASDIIDGAGKLSSTSDAASGILSLANCLIGALNFFRGFSQNAGASDVGFVTLDKTPAVDQNNIAFL